MAVRGYGLRCALRRIGRRLQHGLRRALEVRRVKRAIREAWPLNLVVGSGGMRLSGWISTDVQILDIANPEDWRRLFRAGSIDRILAEHVLEHLTLEQCRSALAEIHRYLKPGGRFRVAVPDGNRRDPAYVAEVSPPKDGHRVLFEKDRLRDLLEEAGFVVYPLEFFDQAGRFNCRDWDAADGLVRRSRRFDRQEAFRLGELCYTSLIADGIKPEPGALR